MQGGFLIPGAGLIAIGYMLQFGSYLRRPRDVDLVRSGVRLRFIGIGVLLLTLGLDLAIGGLLEGPDPGRLALGGFLLVMAATWFYAATDRIFIARAR